ncbi:MAG: GntR family transcriptional regulator [Lachnospiraceae bacterium]|nr:GntR family transcriptional regulator [Lachnospiraceae bacterium]
MIFLDYRDPRPVYEQIVFRFKNLIEAGGLTENERLPSVRQLAIDLGINPNTVQKAYAQLEREGFLYTIKGRGNFVSDGEELKEKRKGERKKAFLEGAKNALQAGYTLEELKEFLEEISLDQT